MKKYAAIFVSILSISGFVRVNAQVLPWMDTTRSLDDRVEWLVQNLTTDEKLSLLVHQNPAVERLGLPAYSWWNEALHGVARAGTAQVFPMPVAMAATFDPALVQRVFRSVAAEGQRKYLEAQDTGYTGDNSGVTYFTPNINIFRDPRWGRGMETYGEDPWLTANMGLACVRGLQGGHTAACIKHLAVHSGPEGVRHEFDSRVGERDLRTTYLPAFEYIVKNSDVSQVMCGYNRLNGEPCCTNLRLLRDILRGEWGYRGIVVTDCWALNDAYELDTVIPRHRTHASAALAYGDAFGTEVDLECGSGLPGLRAAASYGYIDSDKIDEHLRRVLRVRLAATDAARRSRGAAAVPDGSPSPLAVAQQSIVLLKNDGLLPLHASTRLRLEGPNAYDSVMPLGNYNGFPEHTVTIGEALRANIGEGGVVVYAGGLSPELEGEELQVEKEGFLRGDRTRIELPREQVDDLKRLKAEGKRVVLLLCTGSAIALDEVQPYCDAIMVVWYGGQDMGTAVADALFGRTDCFGHLPVTFYGSTAQLPPFDDYDMAGRTYRYLDLPSGYPFGHGLRYNDMRVSELRFRPNQSPLHVEGIVKMDSTWAPQAGSHRAVVQVYLVNLDDSRAPLRQLVGTSVVNMAEGQRTAKFAVDVNPFWLRTFDEGRQQLAAPATPVTLSYEVGLSSDPAKLLPTATFLYCGNQQQ
ncbi:MAG: glycoside hydrolase family 3 C-terminal domain-containing protein [Bacteroidales bacterium]|nr:glycoside hydrolase family 3 C-terminal domain-containing protein [Bacteroidales bacterium]